MINQSLDINIQLKKYMINLFLNYSMLLNHVCEQIQ